MDAYRRVDRCGDHDAGRGGDDRDRPVQRRTGTGAGRARHGRPRPAPANALTAAERAQVLAVLNSAEFVDAAPAQIYAALLDQGVYVASIATMYRMLREHRQVSERRRLARHPARTRPELVADRARGRSSPGTSRNSPARPRASTTTPT